MRIKKTPTANEYIRANDVWVRNFTKKGIAPMAISHMYEREDHQNILANEEHNRKFPKISDEKISFPKLAIVSDGYDFAKAHQILKEVPDVGVLAINGALAGWKLMPHKSINAYVINNPYRESLAYLPNRNGYYPVCVSSIRTNNEFCKRYRGDVYLYHPTPERVFGYERNEAYYIDDYRNPVCAAIGLAYNFGARKVLLLSCDDSFDNKRDGSVQLENGLWTYPQHLKSQDIIDANLYWLTHQEGQEVEVADYSRGRKYLNAAYISTEPGK